MSAEPEGPTPLRLFPHELRVGDTVLVGNEELRVVGKPRRAIGSNHVVVPVRALTGHVDRTFGAHERLAVRRPPG